MSVDPLDGQEHRFLGRREEMPVRQRGLDPLWAPAWFAAFVGTVMVQAALMLWAALRIDSMAPP